MSWEADRGGEGVEVPVRSRSPQSGGPPAGSSRSWGANRFLIRAAVWRSTIEIEIESEIRTRDSGPVPGCQLTEPTGGGGSWRCSRTGQIAAGGPPAASDWCQITFMGVFSSTLYMVAALQSAALGWLSSYSSSQPEKKEAQTLGRCSRSQKEAGKRFTGRNAGAGGASVSQNIKHPELDYRRESASVCSFTL